MNKLSQRYSITYEGNMEKYSFDIIIMFQPLLIYRMYLE